jgi:hypothetical protein
MKDQISATEQKHREAVERGIRMLICSPKYAAFQVIFGNAVFPCTSLLPKGKFGSLAGLGWKSDGYNLCTMCEWNGGLGKGHERLLVLGAYWEKEGGYEGEPAYRGAEERRELMRLAKRVKAGKEPPRHPPLMIRRCGRPSFVCSLTLKERDRVIEAERDRLQAALADLPSKENALT